jgi:hypothetical protein
MRHCSITCQGQDSNRDSRRKREELQQISSWDFPGGTIPSTSVLWAHTKAVVEFFAETKSRRTIDASNSDC